MISKIRNIILIYFYLYKVGLFFKNKERFKNYKVKIFNFIIFFNDPLSFYYEFIYIFKSQVYFFKSSKNIPFIIDGGGFIGTSLLYFKKIYPKSEIVVFEPDKNALKFLYKNIENNNLSNIKVIESGLYKEDTDLRFDVNNTDGGKISKYGDIQIKVEKLSKYIVKEVDFLKLNIEGAELVVFQDLDLNNKFSYIKELCFEWHSFKNQEQNLDEILRILKNNKFKYYISSLEGSSKGKFYLDGNTQFYLMIYAKRIL